MDTVLIVDDTPDNLDILKGILKDTYKVKAAIHGNKALEIASSDSPPDIILLDIMMPEIDGFEICKRLKAKKATEDIPIIFITALGDIENETKGLELGAVDYITKPFNPAVVVARVKTHLELLKQKRDVEKLLSQTLVGSIRVLTELLNAINKNANTIAGRIKPIMKYAVKTLQRDELWRFEIAATLSHIGCVLLEPTVLRKFSHGRLLTQNERQAYHKHLTIGGKLLEKIPRLDEIAQMLKFQTEPLSMQQLEAPLSSLDDLTLGAQLLRTINELTYQQINQPNESKLKKDLLLRHHHPDIVKLIFSYSESKEQEFTTKEKVSADKEVPISELQEGMVLAESCETEWGMTIIPSGAAISSSQLTIIQDLHEQGKLKDTLFIQQ